MLHPLRLDGHKVRRRVNAIQLEVCMPSVGRIIWYVQGALKAYNGHADSFAGPSGSLSSSYSQRRYNVAGRFSICRESFLILPGVWHVIDRPSNQLFQL